MRHKVNENYFEKIDTEEKAYWLGFLYADGYVNYNPQKYKYGLEFSLKASDLKYVELFRNALESDHPIRLKPSKNIKDRSLSTPQYRLTIYNKKLICDLVNAGCVPRKSSILKWPLDIIVSSNLKRHFLRGYIDGDGSIIVRNRKSNQISYGISFISSGDFCYGAQQWLTNQIPSLIRNKITTKCKDMFVLRYAGRIQVSKIFHLLYDDCTISMHRKWGKFEKHAYPLSILSNIRHKGYHKPLSILEASLVTQQYLNGVKYKDISTQFNIDVRTVSEILKKSNIPRNRLRRHDARQKENSLN